MSSWQQLLQQEAGVLISTPKRAKRVRIHSLSDGNAQKWPILFTLHVQVIPKIAHGVWTIVCSFLHTGGVQECANLLS